MAELSKEVRRVGGELEPKRGFATRRLLLPFEIELCKFSKLTEEEYYQFLDISESHNGERDPAYDHVPNIVNESIIIQTIISIVVGYIAHKLAPKPKQRKPPSLQTDDINSQRRYAPQQGFDSVQSLATLGENIPLCFANKNQNPNGGVRVNAKLVWSQMRSLNTSQQLKAIFLLSGGELGDKPDFSGYAIGDTLLESYTNAKLALYFRLNGGALEKGDIYDEGTLAEEKLVDGATTPNSPFAVQWPTTSGTQFKDNIFSGCRTPTTSTLFGGFAPMPNSNMFRVPYELIVIGHGLAKARQNELFRKRSKVERKFPKYCAITGAEDASGTSIVGLNPAAKFDYPVGSTIIYEIAGNDPTDTYADQYQPWGVDDVRSSVDSIRINTDTNLAVGDLYLLGSGLGVIEKIEYLEGTDPRDVGIWLPKNENGNTPVTVKAYFKIIEGGPLLNNAAYLDVRPKGIEQTHRPEELTNPMRAAVATVTNNRNTEVTEIGIKSTVWKQIAGFPNVNSHPGAVKYGHEGTVKNIAKDNGNISLGQINKYVTRYSFFRLYARYAGSNASWELIDGGIPFAVRGNSPQAQYNFIRIKHHSSTDQMEFKFVPYPGNLVKRLIVKDGSEAPGKVRLFAKNTLNKISETLKVNGNKIEVYYSGYEFTLTKGKASNPDWYIGKVEGGGSQIDTGIIKDLHSYKFLDTPSGVGWVEQDRYYEGPPDLSVDNKNVRVAFNDERFLMFHTPGTDRAVGVVGSSTSGTSGLLTEPFAPNVQDIDEVSNIDPNDDKWFYDAPNGKRYTPGARIYEENYPRVDTSRTSWVYWQIVESTWTEPQTMAPQYASITSPDNPNADIGGTTGLLIEVTVYKKKVNNHYPATWKIIRLGSGFQDGTYINIEYNTPDGATDNWDIKIETNMVDAFVSDTPWEGSGENDQSGNNIFPYDAIADIGMYDCERFSNDSGPEHEISVINEQKLISPGPTYDALALAGLRINANKEWSSFSQFSAYIKQGIRVLKLIDEPLSNTTTKYSSNLFPEIAYHLLTNTKDGVGKLIGGEAVDKFAMKNAAEFCKNNGFFFDGVITEAQNLREFIYEHANTCLLDFTVLGGRFGLKSVVPNNGNISEDFGSREEIKISGLFTDGNIKNLKTSFLHPEEKELFKAVVLYREETLNGFPATKTLRRQLVGTNDSAPEEVFDLSNWCCSETHARIFAQYALKVREVVDHGIVFETATNFAVGLEPGSYIKFVSTTSHTDRFSNGSIGPDGFIQSASEVTNGSAIYFWKPGDPDVSEAILTLNADGKETKEILFGSIFTTKNFHTKTRIYKIESISFADDGFIEVAASHCPVDSNNRLEILNWEGQFE